MVGLSLSGGISHLDLGLGVKGVVSGDGSLKLSFLGVENVLKSGGLLSNNGLVSGDFVQKIGFPFKMFGELNVVVFLVDFNFDGVVSEEISEGLDQVTNGRFNGQL